MTIKYEKWSLGYALFKPYVYFAHWLVHKKIIVNGKKNLPKDKPIVFAPNHQTNPQGPTQNLRQLGKSS